MGKYFTIKELTNSEFAKHNKINNSPSEEVENNLNRLVEYILDPLREAYGKPIIVTSGYRSEKLNKLVGGSKTSQHLEGLAADIRSKADTEKENKKIFDLVLELDLPFDQLIDEYNYNWIHVSYSPINRKQILHIK